MILMQNHLILYILSLSLSFYIITMLGCIFSNRLGQMVLIEDDKTHEKATKLMRGLHATDSNITRIPKF